MANDYPKDRFDRIPDDLERVGAHRAPRAGGRGWIWVAWCAAATIVIVGVGSLGILSINGTIDVKLPFSHNTGTGTGTGTPTPTRTATPTPTVVPTVNPALHVTVLNGTTTAGLAADASTTLANAGWKNVTTANASTTDIKETVVYYSVAANAGAAAAMSSELPGSTTALTQNFADSGADLTVVLGADSAAGTQ